MSIISVFPGKGKPKLTTGSATPTEKATTYTPAEGYEGYSQFKVNAIPSAYVNPTHRQGAREWTPTTKDQEIPAETYCAGKQTIKGDADLIPSNIKSGVSIFGVTGTYSEAGAIGNKIELSRSGGYFSAITFSIDTANLIGFYVVFSMDSAGVTNLNAGERALLSLFVDISRGFHIETYWKLDDESDIMVSEDGSKTISGKVSVSDEGVNVNLSGRYMVAGNSSSVFPVYSK